MSPLRPAMNKRFSCADFTFPLLDHGRVLDLLRLLDFEAVDLGVFEDRSHHHPSAIANDPEGAAAKLRHHLDMRGLAVADVFVQTGAEPPVAAANSPDNATRSENRRLIEAMARFATALDATHLTGLPGVRHDGEDADADWQRAVDEAAWRVAACRAAGLTYAVEPHIGSLLPDPESTLRLIQAVPGLTLTLDYGHFIYQSIENERVHPLAAHASHFHARGGAPGQLQSTVRDNTIDFQSALDHLRRAGYHGRICLEYVWIDWEGCNRTDNISETILLRDHLRAI